MNTPETEARNRQTIDAVATAVENYFAELTVLPLSKTAQAMTTIAKMGEITTIKGNVATINLSRLFEV
ncbi:hypothetical protein ACFL2U_00495 [Patescibacteria group bacterium]